MIQLLQNRNFFLLWFAQIISGLGDVLYTVGVMVTIFEETGSALLTVGVTMASTLPSFLFGPLAGALVDRFPRRHMLIIMDLVRAALVGGLLLYIDQFGFEVWGIYLIVGTIAIATTFYTPARLAIIPSLVSRHELVAANSLIMSTTYGTMALGFGLGGLLIIRIGFDLLVLIDLITFLIAPALLLFIHVPKRTTQETQRHNPPIWQSIKEGMGYLRHHKIARPLLTMEVLEHIPHGVWTTALMLVFVETALNGNANDWGYQNMTFYTGQIVGAILATMLAKQMARRPGWAIISNAFLFAMLALTYALSPTPLFATTIAFFFGPPMTFRDVAQDSLLQASVNEQVLGRIISLRFMLINATWAIAGITFAWLADFIPIRYIYATAGIMYAATALYALLNRAIRQSQITPQEVVSRHVN